MTKLRFMSGIIPLGMPAFARFFFKSDCKNFFASWNSLCCKDRIFPWSSTQVSLFLEFRKIKLSDSGFLNTSGPFLTMNFSIVVECSKKSIAASEFSSVTAPFRKTLNHQAQAVLQVHLI